MPKARKASAPLTLVGLGDLSYLSLPLLTALSLHL